ncbi:proton-conducting transporter membrane subunit [Demequina sp.]|uniref:proton-conducting transporter transmembrane domain-containing protein n=1 Tax=Demequina sp. TaxID=2050685 RepID=UPI0025BE4A7D|nr:proton-conducting transporter membrane subunit [Demequina sp.]
MTTGTQMGVLLVPVVAPALAGALAAILGWRRWIAWCAVAASAAVLGAGVVAALATVDGSTLTGGSLLRADALTAVMLLVIGGVSVIATWASVDYIGGEIVAQTTTARGARRYGILVPLFIATMAGAVLAANLGVMWAAVEATTIVTAFLVGHHGGRRAVEATWKYVIICSVGIALAYLGTVLVYYASQHAGGADGPMGTLDWSALVAQADRLDPGVMRIAVVLVVLGFGTKVGLVPLHSWLPDAHSQAPAPVSALMSGVLLSVAAYALLRYRAIAVAALDPAFVRTLLLAVALGSILVAASLMIAQRDYKRLLAYSSMEHMGLVVVGMAVGTPLAMAALLLHVLGHGLAKAVLFCASGQVLDLTGTTRIAGVRGLLARRPVLAGIFALGIAALLGLPPFSLFGSELALARATANAGLAWVVGVALVLLLVVFVAIARPVAGMLLGPAADAHEREGDTGAVASATRRASSAAPLVLGLVALVVIGVATPLDTLLHTAAAIVGTP